MLLYSKTQRLREFIIYQSGEACEDTFKYKLQKYTTGDKLAQNSFLTTCIANSDVTGMNVLPVDWLDMPCRVGAPLIKVKRLLAASKKSEPKRKAAPSPMELVKRPRQG